MSQIANQNKLEHLEGAPPTTGHRALSALTKVTLAALLGNAVAYTAFQLFSLLFSQGFVPQFFVVSQACALIAVVAGLSATLQNYRTSPQACLLVPWCGLRPPF